MIGEHDLWWSYLDNIRLDHRALCRKFGVRPEQIAEQLALTGDKVDNIPGIPEIGRKTAARLLKKYDTLENLRHHLDEVGAMKFRYAASVQRSLIEHQSMLDVGLQLTRINCEIAEMREVGDRIKEIEAEVRDAQSTIDALMIALPNLPLDDVPIGPDESSNVIVEQVGEPADPGFE